jgi:hypothetical protein
MRESGATARIIESRPSYAPEEAKLERTNLCMCTKYALVSFSRRIA